MRVRLDPGQRRVHVGLLARCGRCSRIAIVGEHRAAATRPTAAGRPCEALPSASVSRGRLITIEGLDGAGKSTLALGLHSALG